MAFKAVCFDCDGVLVETISSWRIIHEYFGTNSGEMLDRFLRGEVSDAEFMADDIRLWKSVKPKIHRDELMRCYQGVKLMPGAKELIQELKEAGIFVAIVSAGVDLFVSSIAAMLKVDDWIANGFKFNEDDTLSDEGICRLHATKKDVVIEKILNMHGFEAKDCVSVGDSEMDLSMQVEGSRFIGFNPSRESSLVAFKDSGVPIVFEKDLLKLKPHFGLD